MPQYDGTTFADLSTKRKETVRTKIEELWKQGLTPTQISKKVRLGHRSVATAVGNLTRQTTTTKRKRR